MNLKKPTGTLERGRKFALQYLKSPCNAVYLWVEIYCAVWAVGGGCWCVVQGLGRKIRPALTAAHVRICINALLSHRLHTAKLGIQSSDCALCLCEIRLRLFSAPHHLDYGNQQPNINYICCLVELYFINSGGCMPQPRLKAGGSWWSGIGRGVYPGGVVPPVVLFPRWCCSPGGVVPPVVLFPRWCCSEHHHTFQVRKCVSSIRVSSSSGSGSCSCNKRRKKEQNAPIRGFVFSSIGGFCFALSFSSNPFFPPFSLPTLIYL
jgi:hypothetical protein